jgi:hypothetical protein
MSKPKTRPKRARARPKRAANDLPTEAPSAKYQPTEREAAVVAKSRARCRQTMPPVTFSVIQAEQNPATLAVTLDVDHPSKAMGHVLVTEALGTANPLFKDAMVTQLIRLATTGRKVSQPELNRLFAMVQGINPRDETEAMLAVQMAAIQNATIEVARYLSCATMLPQIDSHSNALNKLARTFAVQMETLKRYRSTGEQSIRVQHVTVNDGGQAVVAGGDVKARGGVAIENEGQPHGPAKGSERGTPMLGNVKALETEVQSTGGEGLECVPLPRSTGRSARG